MASAILSWDTALARRTTILLMVTIRLVFVAIADMLLLLFSIAPDRYRALATVNVQATLPIAALALTAGLALTALCESVPLI